MKYIMMLACFSVFLFSSDAVANSQSNYDNIDFSNLTVLAANTEDSDNQSNSSEEMNLDSDPTIDSAKRKKGVWYMVGGVGVYAAGIALSYPGLKDVYGNYDRDNREGVVDLLLDNKGSVAIWGVATMAAIALNSYGLYLWHSGSGENSRWNKMMKRHNVSMTPAYDPSTQMLGFNLTNIKSF